MLFSHSGISGCLWPYGLQHDRLPCSSLFPRLCSNSCPLSWWCHPIISSSVTPSPLALNLSQHQWISSESALHIWWLKYWRFSFSIGPSNEYSRLISFRIDWFDLLAAHGTLMSILQNHRLKAPILWYSTFLMVQLSHPYMATGKTITLTIWSFAGKVMSLFFNMLSRLTSYITKITVKQKYLESGENKKMMENTSGSTYTYNFKT